MEIYNRTILTCIASFMEEDHRSWDLYLSQVQFAISSAVNETTGFTPSFLVYGTELVSCGSHYLDSVNVDNLIFAPRNRYAENLGCLANILDKVQFRLSSFGSFKEYFKIDLRHRPAEFNVGDFVYKKAYFLSDKDNYSTRKLAPKYVKCKIVGKKSPLLSPLLLVYVLQDLKVKDLGVWHIKDLKLTGS